MADRLQQLIAFDETKAGVKGLVDSGLSQVPPIFIRPSNELVHDHNTTPQTHQEVPVIDLCGTRNRIVEQVKDASQRWGFFQVVNHGIPQNVLDGMIHGIKMFNEMDVEEKSGYYSRDFTKKVRYQSNSDLFTSTTACWRDSMQISFPVQPHELPPCCRESTIEYSNHISNLGKTLLEVLSEGLGLKPDYLNTMGCGSGKLMSGHYYPACPQPELTIGAIKHSDIGFITILLQNQISGLQILYQDQWVDIQPIHGALIVNIGDLLQLVSNGKFKSSMHRVVSKSIGPRISVACFLSGPFNKAQYYGPIEELINQENPPKYRKVLFSEYVKKFATSAIQDYPGLNYYKL